MGQDEVGTLRALKSHRRELVDPTIARDHGRIVRTTGDGMLAEFASIVDALGSAIRSSAASGSFSALASMSVTSSSTMAMTSSPTASTSSRGER
jgi:adenylate cyclase